MPRIALALLAFLALAAPARALTIREQQCFYMRHDGDGCRRSNGMQGANDVVVSPDGRNVYAVSGFEDYGALVSFRRNRSTGALTQLPGRHGCVSDDGRNAQANLDRRHGIGLRGRCAQAGPMPEASNLAIAPDGATIYVLGEGGFRSDGDSIVAFHRDRRTGYVREIQCWTRLGTPHCPRTRAGEPSALAITPDGRELVVAGQALTTFAVGGDGRLSAPVAHAGAPAFAGSLAVSPDGATVYATAGEGSAGRLFALARDPGTGALTARADVSTVAGPRDVAVAPDGRGIYVAAVSVEQRDSERDLLDASTLVSFGADPLAQVGCAVYEGRDPDPGCTKGPALYEPQTLAVTPDGLHAVAGFIDSGTLLLLDRDPATQRLTPVGGAAGCVTGHNNWIEHRVRGCRWGHGLYAPLSVAISPDGRNAYLAGDDGLAAFALR